MGTITFAVMLAVDGISSGIDLAAMSSMKANAAETVRGAARDSPPAVIAATFKAEVLAAPIKSPQTEVPIVVEELEAKARAVAALCRAVASEEFSVVFQKACGLQSDFDDLFVGLAMWVGDGARPKLQGRTDLALHFIFAGAFEATFGMGREAAVFKEALDEANNGGCDRDDIAAGFSGVEWVRRARLDPHWMERWASGKNDFERNLPPFRYGNGDCSFETQQGIRANILTAYDK